MGEGGVGTKGTREGWFGAKGTGMSGGSNMDRRVKGASNRWVQNRQAYSSLLWASAGLMSINSSTYLTYIQLRLMFIVFRNNNCNNIFIFNYLTVTCHLESVVLCINKVCVVRWYRTVLAQEVHMMGGWMIHRSTRK